MGEEVANLIREQEAKLPQLLELINASDWKKGTTKPEIQYYSRSDPSSKYAMIKSEVTIPAPVSEVDAVLDILVPIDENTPKDAREGCIERYPLEGHYVYNSVPGQKPIVSPRDFLVFRHKHHIGNQVVMCHTSVKNDRLKPERPGFVRGTCHFEIEVVTPTEDPNVCRLTYACHVDPSGTLPAWLFNMIAEENGLEAKRILDRVLANKK